MPDAGSEPPREMADDGPERAGPEHEVIEILVVYQRTERSDRERQQPDGKIRTFGL
jgi:hypothetical protein